MKGEVDSSDATSARVTTHGRQRSRSLLSTVGLVLLCLSTYFFYRKQETCILQGRVPDLSQVQRCTVKNLHRDLSFLDNAKAITASEFIERRDRLAAALATAEVDAFVLEPGYTFQYYGNISQTDWEPWEPEERPFLMVVRPTICDKTGKVKAHTSFLSPAFEAGRVRMLGIPSNEQLEIVTWEEHWNPYDTLRTTTFANHTDPKVMVDEEMRDYIVRGLMSAGFTTTGLSPTVEAVRQQKSPAEIELLRAVNTATVEAVRRMRPCLVPGLIENEVTTILNNALLSMSGFSLFFNIVLFEENAALPHGGFITGDKVLTKDTMVLIDVGAHYKGYSSDICRSFFIGEPPSKDRATPITDPLYFKKLSIWHLVLQAQEASMAQFKPNQTAASVDIAARNVIAAAGWEKQFTHRVGHGIGIKAHESPYLNKGNTGVKLLEGMTFTSEPGVYIEGEFGVRHEDIFLVRSGGQEAECLSGRRARGPWDP